MGAQTSTIRLGAGAALQPALSAYRTEFQPSERRDRPYVMVGVNVLAADTTAAAIAQLKSVRRARAVGQFGRQFGVAGPDVSDEHVDEILAAGAAPHVDEEPHVYRGWHAQ